MIKYFHMNITSVEKPWGSFTTFIKNEPATVKLLYVNKGEEFSLQYHQNREEFWKVIKGTPEIVLGEQTISAKPDDEFTVLKEMKHRISAPHDDVVVLEIATGNFDEEDIIRIQDKYGRS